jgi:hypothetical protein
MVQESCAAAELVEHAFIGVGWLGPGFVWPLGPRITHPAWLMCRRTFRPEDISVRAWELRLPLPSVIVAGAPPAL